ncbi:MAG: hypothetical protein EBR82_52120 [Caulobacteraceae bacterium]|nr:hypothetical protein [Caulobacteraceae bacterium]
MAAANTTPQAVLDLQKKYIDLKLENTDRFLTGTGSKAKFNEAAAQKAVIQEVYKFDPRPYLDKKGNVTPTAFATAASDYDREQPKLTFAKAENFAGAISEFDKIIQQVNTIGVDRLNKVDRATIGKMARQVRDYKSKTPSENEKNILENIGLAEDALGKIVDQIETVRVAGYRAKGLDADGFTKVKVNKQDQTNFLLKEQDTLRRYISEAKNAIPDLSESLSRLDVTDVVRGVGQQDSRIGGVDTGLSGLSAEKLFDKSSLANRLNFQVTDEQIRADLAATRKTSAESIYKLGNEALVDLNSRLEQANAFKAGLDEGDPRLKSTQDVIDSLIKDIADVTADTNQAKAIFDNPGDIGADTVASFRETLRLDEERALDEIGVIDPNYLATSRALSDQFRGMASGPLGPTQDARTEEMRGLIEDEALNQLRLGSTLDESVRREVQQATRGAQAARGNVFGVGPAVEEAMQTGLMAEQRRNQRYGAAAAFLGSGQSRGDQAARNTSLRQSLDLARLGAANDFVAAGANPYNLAAQRVSNTNANAINYINAQNAASGGFANTANVVNPFMFVDPQAGFRGAQNAANIFGTYADYQARTYGAYANAQAQLGAANSIPNYISAFSSLVPSFSFGR